MAFEQNLYKLLKIIHLINALASYKGEDLKKKCTKETKGQRRWQKKLKLPRLMM